MWHEMSWETHSSGVILSVLLPTWFAIPISQEHKALLVCLSLRKKLPQTGGLTHQRFLFSQAWKGQVQARGAVRAGFWWELCPWLCRQPHVTLPMCTEEGRALWCLSCFPKDTQFYPIRAPPRWPHFSSLTSLCPNSIPLGLRLPPANFRGHNSVHKNNFKAFVISYFSPLWHVDT